MPIDLKDLDTHELNELIARAEKRRQQLQRDRINDIRRQLTAKAKAEGYTIEELFGIQEPKSANAGRKVKPKYRNPADPSQTWAGRGKQPHWFTEALASGKSEKDLLA